MSRHDRVIDGMGLHGQAIISAIEILEELRDARPDLEHVCNRIGVDRTDLQHIFQTEESLLIAVAEQALVRLIDSTTKAIVREDQDDPIGQFLALGDNYLDWAVTHPMQFRLINDNNLVDIIKTPELRRYIDSMTELMIRILKRAQDSGFLDTSEDIPQLALTMRILGNGLARMVVDSRLQEFHPEAPAMVTARQIMRASVRHFTVPRAGPN